jgi:hypothetical protein
MVDGLVEPFAAPEAVWNAIVELTKHKLSDEETAVLAAGPLEGLLAKYGEDFIERIEVEARRDPIFAHLLGGVWPSSIASDIWKRVELLRGSNVW